VRDEGVTLGSFLADSANWRIIADLLLIGAFGGFYIVPLYALVQQRSEASHRSRVIAGNNILNALFMVVAAIFAMLMLGRAGFTIPELFLATAVLNALVAIYIFTLVPEFLLRFLIWILIHTIYRVRARGLENIPEEGQVIVADNRASFVDPLIIGGMVRRARPIVAQTRCWKRVTFWVFSRKARSPATATYRCSRRA
jgi:hypothetical protein